MKKQILIATLLFSPSCFSSQIYDIVKLQYDSEAQKTCEFSNKQIVASSDYTAELVTAAGCGGGNHSESWVVLYNLDNKFITVKEVGRDFVFVPTAIEFKNEFLNVVGKAWSTDDLHCCPSIDVIRQYIPSATDLVQIK